MAENDEPVSGEEAAPGPEDGRPASPPRKPRRRRKATAAVVGAVIDAMDAPDAASSAPVAEPTSGAEAEEVGEAAAASPPATEASEDAAAPPAADIVEPGAGRAPRSRSIARAMARLAVAFLAVLVVLAIGAALGFVSGTLVPGFADASPPVATLAPPTERPTPPPLPTARPTPTPTAAPTAAPTPTPRVHTVRRNENLTQIATRYGVTVQAIVAANGIKDANRIEIGQKLIIPSP